MRVVGDRDADADPEPGPLLTGGDVVLPPQAMSAQSHTAGSAAATRRRLGPRTTAIDKSSSASEDPRPPTVCTKNARRPAACAAVRAVVEIVNVEGADPPPGDTAGGVNDQAAPIGRFAQPRVTGDAKGPPCEATLTWYDAESPAFTVADAGETPTPKFVTVI